MKAIHLTGPSLDAFERVELDEPVPQAGEALVRLHAASLNFIDVAVATGASSVFAIPLAKACGARVIVTSSSDEKLQRARSLGADHLVNCRATPEWDREILEITGGAGVDLVLETAGAQSFARSLQAVR